MWWIKRNFLKLADLFGDPRNPIRIPYFLLRGPRNAVGVELEEGMDLYFSITVDVEHDFGIPSTLGSLSTVEEGMENLLEFFEEKSIEATFFVSNPVFQEFPELVKRASEKHEIGVHGYNHECWSEPKWWLKDDRILDKEQKDTLLKRMINSVKNTTSKRPKSFRAPYMAADEETLTLLDKYGFEVDSSAPSYYGVFPKPYYPNDLSLLEIPVSASPIPEFKAKPYPHSDFNFLITKLLSTRGLEWCLKFIIEIIKFQLQEDVILHQVMVLHQWEFAGLDKSPTQKSEYAVRENKGLLEKMLAKLEEKFEVHYLCMKKLREQFI